jgi:hypothetical protein
VRTTRPDDQSHNPEWLLALETFAVSAQPISKLFSETDRFPFEKKAVFTQFDDFLVGFSCLTPQLTWDSHIIGVDHDTLVSAPLVLIHSQLSKIRFLCYSAF